MKIRRIANLFSLIVYLSCIIIYCTSECENGCSGHGICTVYDMCLCARNWEGNDCSDRICQFGRAVVDIPKGDLDFSQAYESPSETVVVNSAMFPYGATEAFPNMVDSDLNKLSDSAHEYVECSNAGICNKETGECECFDGFEGVACQRLSCPGEDQNCNGHGVCQSMHQVARVSNEGSQYNLWSQDLLTGCVCDPGFHGYDCSMRHCPAGVDPLFFDDVQTIQYPFFFFSFMTTAPTFDLTSGVNGDPAYFNIIVFDTYGEPYSTRMIQLPTTCEELINAVEEIPNGVVPKGYTRCYHNDFMQQDAVTSSFINVTYQGLYRSYFGGIKVYVNIQKPAALQADYVGSYKNLTVDSPMTGQLFLLQFYGNPGDFKQPILNVFPDGNRITVHSPGGVAVAKTWTNGQHSNGENFFSRRCPEIHFKLRTTHGKTYLWGSYIFSKFVACLADADYDPSNNIEDLAGISYDPGTIENPHVIQLVRTVSDYRDGRLLALIMIERGWFDSQGGEYQAFYNPNVVGFRVLHPIHSWDFNENDIFDIYTTRGVLQRVQNGSRAEFDFGSKYIYLTNISDAYAQTTTPFKNQISCDAHFHVQGVGANSSTLDCIDKNDYMFLLDPYQTFNNPPFLNMYKVESVRTVVLDDAKNFGGYDPSIAGLRERANERVLITTDLNTNWASSVPGGANIQVYRFTPDYDDVYHTVTECSNRGLCNTFEGICECFHGYSGAACEVQTAIVS